MGPIPANRVSMHAMALCKVSHHRTPAHTHVVCSKHKSGQAVMQDTNTWKIQAKQSLGERSSAQSLHHSLHAEHQVVIE